MIFDHIMNRERYRVYPKLYEGLCWLAELTEESFPQERVVLDGTKKFVVPKTYTTKAESEAVFEAHHTQVDIHYMVKGVEDVQTADLRFMTPKGAFNIEYDHGDFIGTPDGTYRLRPGYFLATFPDEAHKTGIAPEENAAPILKAVYKYTID